jgi:hypothetical protein
MKSKSRRYEVLLPMRFNDGREVPDEVLAEAVNEIVDQFGAVSLCREPSRAAGGMMKPSSGTISRFLSSI